MCDEIEQKLTNLCLDVINNKINAKLAFETIVTLTKKNEEISSILLDILSFVEWEIDGDKNEEKKTIFGDFLNLLMDVIIPESILRAELDFLDASKAEHNRQLVRCKTRVYFKQSKYNMLREETEGYSKLITELIEAENSTNENHHKVVSNRILALIGQFNLDPNRVTDLILECFEHFPKQKTFFIGLLAEINAVREYLIANIGFKYTFYQDPNKKTPYSLNVLTSTLIQYDLVDMMKVLAFMTPKTDEIKNGHRERAANANERSSKAETISTASMPLSDCRSIDENPSNSSQTSQTISFTTVTQIQENDDAKLAAKFSEEHVLATNQKIGLACALLESGNWKKAQLLIDRLPEYYAVQASPRLCRALCKIIEKSIEDFYQKQHPKSPFYDSLKTSSASKYEEEDDEEEEKEEKQKKNLNGLKRVEKWEDLIDLSKVLWYLGPRIAYRSTTLVKLLRILTSYFRKENQKEIEKNEKLYRLFIDIVAECILPSLTLSETNVAQSEEIWQLMQLLPYTWRYWMYSKWNQETARTPELNIMKGKIYGRTKYVLKRLSKETVKVMGRQLGKLCHIHPTTVLSYLLSQIQTFDNLIGPVVEGLRFLTSLEFDVLTYCIISQLADPSKQALKSSDATISPWLQALGTLVGSLYRRYPLELSGMLDYVLNQLKNCKSFDLLILREIIQNMSWIESSHMATNEQIEALGGGELLRQEAGGYSTARNKRAAQRLRDAIVKGDLAVGLCICIAQQKDFIVFHESEKLPLKLVGEMVDQCSLTLQQLIAFLVSYLKNDEYSKRLPTIQELLIDFSLKIEAAMSLARPTFIPKIMEAYDVAKKKLRAEANSIGAAAAAAADETVVGSQRVKIETSQKLELFKAEFEAKIVELGEDFKKWQPKIEERIPIRLYTVFWMLGNYDVMVPTAAYERTIENLKKQQQIADDHTKTRRGDEKVKQLEMKLKEEQKRQSEHVDRVRAWLICVKDTLIVENQKVTESFLQMCILPRALLSELDAVYCGKLFFLLHEIRTPFFQTVVLIDKVFENVLILIAGLTENEANSLARFLEILLSQSLKWHCNQELFESECLGFPGLVSKNCIDFATFKKLGYRWQIRLAKILLSVLSKEDVDYVVTRNCLILMTKLTPCFPIFDSAVKSMEAIAIKVRDREKGKRDDLSLKAASYVGRLKKRNVKTYAQVTDFAPIPIKKKEVVKKEVNDEGEPAEKKLKTEKNGSATSSTTSTTTTNGTNGIVKKEKTEEDGKEKKRKSAPTGIYVPKHVTAEKEKIATASAKKSAKDGKAEDGEVTTPSPPPVKKSRLGERLKKSEDVNSRSEKKEKIKEKPVEVVKERKLTAKKEEKKRDKENGETKKEERRKENKEERNSVAGPELPSSMNKTVVVKEKTNRKSMDSTSGESGQHESKRKERKEHEKKQQEIPLKSSKIASAEPRNRDRERNRERR